MIDFYMNDLRIFYVNDLRICLGLNDFLGSTSDREYVRIC
jgi:hypothetical protein